MQYRSFFHHKNFTCTCQAMNIISVVPFPDMKPNCIASILTSSLMYFSITQQLQSSEIPMLHCISFTFDAVYDNTHIPITWNFLFSYDVVKECCEKIQAASSEACSISVTKPKTPAALSSFIFLQVAQTASLSIQGAEPSLGSPMSKLLLFHGNSTVPCLLLL